MLEDASGSTVRETVSLADYTSFHIGGPAALFCEATSIEGLAGLLRISAKQQIPRLILGGGTNLLVSDSGFDGLAIRLAIDRATIDPERRIAEVEAGVRTADLVQQTTSLGLNGLAFAAGLPGSVGGGLTGNAGCFGSCLSDVMRSATVVSPTGDIVEIPDPQWFAFAYRHSNLLKNGHVLVRVRFALTPGDREAIEAEANSHIALRRQKHPSKDTHTAGSFFKNLPPLRPGERRRAAGLYLDRVGARELTVGDAAVFERHANIVINRGKATAEDVLTLTREMKRRVKERFDIDLTPEVRFVGERPAGL